MYSNRRAVQRVVRSAAAHASEARLAIRTAPRLYLNRRALRQVVRSAVAHASPRRAATWTGFGAAWIGLRALTGLAWRLDERLFPRWREHRVEAPVFIFANGRSGTTMLHRLLALDTERFAPYKLYQSVFSGVTTQRLIATLGRNPTTARLGRPFVDWINATFFSGWEGIHELGIDKEEEDEATFVLAMESPTVSLLNAFTEDYQAIGWLDDASPAHRRAFMDYYETVLQKHLYADGEGRRFLTKNVFMTPRVETILERFDDARFIYLVRNPLQALPSWLNMFYEKWVTHSPELPPDSPEARRLAQMCFAYYRHILARRERIPTENLTVVRYDELVKDPKAVVERLYEWLGMELTPEYRARLEAFTARQRRYRSKHHYSLEQFGLTEGWVRAQIPEVFEAFGF